MDSQEELLSFLDLMDLDEDLIDAPLRYLMGRNKYSMKHLKNAIQLLQYKALINSQEGTECDNEHEFDFAVKLVRDLDTTNIDYACKIINIVLCLNTDKIVSKAEHLLQQILSEIEFRSETPTSGFPETDKYTKILLILKASDSILNATINNGEKLSMIFLETPLEKILDTPDEKLKIYFLANTVPRFMEGVVGYNILNRIWVYLKYLKRIRKEDALKILGCLSDYYLPSPERNGEIKFVSQIVFEYDFWDIVLYGLTSDDTSLRKISVYLSKKAIDYVIFSIINLDVKLKDHTIFEWKKNNNKTLKRMWDNFFILIDSLEEKQGNIVLPSLKLFESIQIGNCWLNAAFNIGLKHDNTQVRLKCIEYKLKTEIGCPGDAEALLGALNDINIYDQTLYNVNKILKEGMKNLLQYTHSFMNIVRAIPKIKWSPVPFYLLTEILAELNIIISKENKPEIIKLITEILKVPCNSVVLRKGVHLNIAHFVSKCCGNLDPKDVANIYDVIQLKTSSEINKENPFNSVVKHISLQKEDKVNYLKLWSEKNSYIDLIIMYLYNNEEDIALLGDIINEKLRNINGGVSRQYANKTDTLKDVIFLMHMSNKTKNRDSNLHSINELISSQNKILLQYILSIFSSNIIITVEHAIALFEKHNLQFAEKDLGETLLQIYMTSLLFLNNNSELDKAVFSMCAVKMLHKNPIMLSFYKHEMLNLKKLMDLVSTLQFNDFQNESVGKLKNLLYEQSCQIVYILIEQGDKIEPCKDDLIKFIEHMLECGGYGCLKWILKIMNKIIIHIDNFDNFNMTQFINRVWNEIEELKSNNQYSPCIEEFVDLITQDGLLQKSMYNNIIISYCNKIIEYGPVKTNPLYYLIRKLNTKDFKDYGHLVYVLCEILLYCPVPRKDQRITDNLTLEVMENVCFGINKYCNDVHFNYEIQWLSISTLCSISDLETLQIIANFITSRIDNTFKNKQRYHGNSQMHRVLQTSLQHLLILVLKGVNVENILKWCFNLLVKLPHQPSVRTCLDWIISLHFYIQKMDLTEEMLRTLKSNNVPLNSQFFIMYWILKHKITNNTYSEEEYNCVLDFLLSHTMGQLFNVRLNAQYLAITLYKLANKQTKFQYTIEIIEKTFSESSNDKNYTKLTSDYFTNKFDIVANLSPYFIYYLLPKVCEVDNNEKVNVSFVKNVLEKIESIGPNVSNEFINEWKKCDKIDETFNDSELVKRDHSNVIEDSEGSGTIQKKYVPWKNMSDINLYGIEKKRESPSQLIVVASLIDKLPNLGGMARTSEVFGVQTYVVDSLRHLQDKQFQGLSVSAERWINVEEVRPGQPLKDYLMKKKEEGYSVVAAEQTSTSSKLQSFKFPKKTILLLGHEKEGVPCDLLPIMDHCVEIPQQGYVRSLNVHVTAAIFVWEYARQNVL